MINLKKGFFKKAISLAMCICIIGLTGCVGNVSADPSKDTTTSSTTVTTTTTTTTTSTYATTTTTTATTTTTELSSTATASTTTTTTKDSSSVKEEGSTVKTTKTTTTTKPSTTTTRDPREYDPNIEKLVALTFDDGPSASVTNRILDTLEKYGAKATFFVVADRFEKYPNTVPVIQRASRLGCEIASHTWSHKNLTELTAQEISTEIGKSTIKIATITGKPVTLVRPPEGALNDLVKQTVKYPLIMWSVDSMDWKNRNAQKNYNAVVNAVFDGSIVLMHDLYSETAAAVEKIIPDLMARGYKFVTVTELMQARGVQMKNGKRYSQARP